MVNNTELLGLVVQSLKKVHDQNHIIISSICLNGREYFLETVLRCISRILSCEFDPETFIIISHLQV